MYPEKKQQDCGCIEIYDDETGQTHWVPCHDCLLCLHEGGYVQEVLSAA